MNTKLNDKKTVKFKRIYMILVYVLFILIII